MNTRTTMTMSLMASLALAMAHCGGGDDSAAPGGGTGDGGSSDGGTGGETSTGEGGGGGGVTIDGYVLSGSTAYANAPIALIDANGARIDATTGGDGAFHVEHVMAPYDVYLASVDFDGGVGTSPVYYAGLTRKDPVLSGNDEVGSVLTSLRTGSITFTINFGSGNKMFVSTPQNSVTELGTGASKKYTDFTVSWIGDTTLTTDVHFSVATPTGSLVAYLDETGVVVNDGAATDLGTLPAFVVYPATTMTTVQQAVPSGYTAATTNVQFFGLDGSLIHHQEASAATLSAYLLPLANVRARFSAQAGGPNGESSFTELAFVDYSAVPSSVDLQVQAMPSGLTPADDATGIAPATQQLAWTGGTTPTTYAVSLVGTGATPIEVFTSGTSFDLSRLGAAGFSLKAATAYKWTVSTTSDMAIDDFIAPGAKPFDAPTGKQWSTGSSKQQTFTTQ